MTATKVRITTEKRHKNKMLGNALKSFMYCALGAAFSFSGVSGFSPFAIAFCSAAEQKKILFAAAGATVGYFFALGSVEALRYTVTVLAVTVIYFALGAFKHIREHIAAPVGISFICTLSTGLALTVANSLNIKSVLLAFSESCVCGTVSYLFTLCRKNASLKRRVGTLTSKDAVAAAMVVSLLLMAFKPLSLGAVSPARILCGTLVILCAHYCREAGGAIVGVCGGTAMSLGQSNVFFLALFSLGGLLSGAASRMGRLASASAFLLCSVGVGAIVGISAQTSVAIFESAVSCALFLALSVRFNSKLEMYLSPSVNSPAIESVKADVVKRLKNASGASAEICTSLQELNSAMLRNEKRAVDSVCKSARERVCGSCGLYDSCWLDTFEQTQDCFNTLLMLKKDGVFLEYKTAPAQFASRCIRTESICDSFNRLYSEFKARERVESRVREIYTLASEQFINVSSLLDSLSLRAGEQMRFDMDIAAKARTAAASLELEALESCCVYDSFDKLKFELHLKNGEMSRETEKKLKKQLEAICGRELDYPTVEARKGETVCIYTEKPRFRVVSSVSRSCANGEKYSGDSFASFKDSDGYFYAVLCDGMGSGARAAVSSGLAVTLLEKLIKAGFGVQAAIKAVNSSLISHSGEECSVTLDLAVVDMFTGGVEFYKCGAVESLVKKNGKITSVGAPSMPLGILSDAECDTLNCEVADGGVILMCTDGVREDDMAFVRSELKTFSGGSVRDFTSSLCETVRRYQPERNDDMTVFTIAITEND